MKRLLQFVAGIFAIAVCVAIVWFSTLLTASPSGSSVESEAATTPSVTQRAESGAVATPSVTEPAEDFAESALNYTRQHVHVLSGQPQVISSQQVTYAELNALGLSIGNYGPSCTQPQQLVILHGDFDMRGAAPMSLAPSVPVPATYIAYVYDLRTGDQVSIQWDRDGSHFKKALHDPSLPDVSRQVSEAMNTGTPTSGSAPSAPAPVSPYLSCIDHFAPGWATPPSKP